MGEQVVVGGRDAVHQRRAVLDDRAQQRLRVEARDHDERRPRHHRRVEDAGAVDVRQRQRVDDAIVRAARGHRRGAHRGTDHRPMRLHRALRVARGARRVADRREIAPGRGGTGVNAARPVRASRQRGRAGGIRRPTGRRPRGSPVPRRSSSGSPLSGDADHGARAGVLDDVADLVGREHHVDRDHDGAGLRDAVVGDEPLPAVRAVQRHPVAGLHAVGHEAVRGAVRQRVEVVERERAVAHRSSAVRAPNLRAAVGRTSPIVLVIRSSPRCLRSRAESCKPTFAGSPVFVVHIRSIIER